MVVTASSKKCRENCDDEYDGGGVCAYEGNNQDHLLLFNDECEFEKYKCLHPHESWYKLNLFVCSCNEYAKHQKYHHICK